MVQLSKVFVVHYVTLKQSKSLKTESQVKIVYSALKVKNTAFCLNIQSTEQHMYS